MILKDIHFIIKCYLIFINKQIKISKMMRVQLKKTGHQGNSLLLEKQLENSALSLQTNAIKNRILLQIKHRQDKVYNLHAGESLNYMKSLFSHMEKANPTVSSLVDIPTHDRILSVVAAINESRLEIQEKSAPHSCKSGSILMVPPPKIQKEKNQQDSRKNIDSEEKKKKIEEFARQQRKEQLKRKRKWEKLQRLSEEAYEKQENRIKEQDQKRKIEKRNEILKKQKQRHHLRDEEKIIREQRNSQFLRIKSKLNQNPPLYASLSKRYEIVNEKINKQKNQKMVEERKHLLEHLTKDQFEEHERKYLEFLAKQEKQRKQRRDLVNQQQKARMKPYSSVDFPKSINQKAVQRQIALQKRSRIHEYYAKVKEQYKPQIDEEKRKQLTNLIDKMEMKRVKNVKIENGQLYYENFSHVDHKQIGKEYLGQVKQMVEKNRGKRKKRSENQFMGSSVEEKKVDYLEDLKQKRKMKKDQRKKRFREFLDNQNVSYDDKIKKVLAESQKISEGIKLKEQKLKYGKFKTSEQILAYKWDIDQNYINMANMKLKLLQ